LLHAPCRKTGQRTSYFHPDQSPRLPRRGLYVSEMAFAFRSGSSASCLCFIRARTATFYSRLVGSRAPLDAARCSDGNTANSIPTAESDRVGGAMTFGDLRAAYIEWFERTNRQYRMVPETMVMFPSQRFSTLNS
jgi:hypothetical protein